MSWHRVIRSDEDNRAPVTAHSSPMDGMVRIPGATFVIGSAHSARKTEVTLYR